MKEEKEVKVDQPQNANMENMQSMMMQQMMRQQTMMQNQMYQQMQEQRKRDAISDKSRFVYIMLALFFGGVGFHNFYAGRSGRGFLQLLLGITVVGCLITVPWSLLEMLFVKKDGNGKKFK